MRRQSSNLRRTLPFQGTNRSLFLFTPVSRPLCASPARFREVNALAALEKSIARVPWQMRLISLRRRRNERERLHSTRTTKSKLLAYLFNVDVVAEIYSSRKMNTFSRGAQVVAKVISFWVTQHARYPDFLPEINLSISLETVSSCVS